MSNATWVILATLVATLCAATYAAPFSLDMSSLSNAWNEAGVSSYKCKSAFKDFGKAVADANAESAARRTKLDTTARVYLKQQMEKAQADGDLDKVLVFKTAVESARGGEIAGDDEAIVKLRESYEKQLALVDRTLLEAGLGAEHVLYATLDWQKSETTKKGDIVEAQKIAAFQTTIEDWTKTVQTQATQAASAQSAAKTTVMRPQPRPQSRESLSTIKQLEPEAKIYTINAKSRNGTSIGEVNAGDTIEIQYVDGKWETYPDEPVESPDQNEIRHGGCRLKLSKFAERNYVVAVIPAGTQYHPFRYFVDESTSGVLALRIGGEHVSDNVGSVRYSVKIIPGEASRLAAQSTVSSRFLQANQPAETSGSSAAENQGWRNIQIRAIDARGTLACSAKVGDVIEVKYVDGDWTYMRNGQRECPDSDGVVDFGNRCVLAYSFQWAQPLAVLPEKTKQSPFMFKVDKSGGFILRINDGDRESSYRDNSGSVRYMVRVIPANKP